VTNFYPFQANI